MSKRRRTRTASYGMEEVGHILPQNVGFPSVLTSSMRMVDNTANIVQFSGASRKTLHQRHRGDWSS